MENKFKFKGNDPGAVTLGNFINYYSFNSPNKRMEGFPKHLWKCTDAEEFLCLDVGCNTGDLTEELFSHFSKNLIYNSPTFTPGAAKCVFLALDVDPILIERAHEKNKHPDSIQYECADIMDSSTNIRMSKFLSDHNKQEFDVTSCFSVTMWIHLNHGDDGLKTFLKNICDKSKMVVIEPQPWKCYKSAVKRLRRQQVSLPNFNELLWRETVDTEIEGFLTQTCNYMKLHETQENNWGRKVIVLQKR